MFSIHISGNSSLVVFVGVTKYCVLSSKVKGNNLRLITMNTNSPKDLRFHKHSQQVMIMREHLFFEFHEMTCPI